MSQAGLSPRVRGNLFAVYFVFQCPRSIPACAGQPYLYASSSNSSAVYPRVCGATQAKELDKIQRMGLSPRVRGNH